MSGISDHGPDPETEELLGEHTTYPPNTTQRNNATIATDRVVINHHDDEEPLPVVLARLGH